MVTTQTLATMKGHSMLLALACLVLGAQARQLLMTPQSTAVSSLKDSDFDYFMLVRQWSGTFCAHAECPMVHRHGYVAERGGSHTA